MKTLDARWATIALMLVVILLAVAAIVLRFSYFANIVAGWTIVVFAVSGVIVWLRGEDTKKAPRAIVAALACSAGGALLLVLMDTAPRTLPSQRSSFVPNGTGRLAFTKSLAQEIHVINADGTGEALLTSDEDGGSEPAWSPSGKQIAFAHRSGSFGDREIYVANANGTNRTRLTNSLAASNEFPVWSPDGQRIAFLSNRDSHYEVYVMNADGTNQTRLTRDYQHGYCTPAWSPDGRHLAFVSRHEASSPEVYIIDADGTAKLELPHEKDGYKSTQRAAWSPDGEQIAFVGEGGVYVMKADGTNRIRLTDLGSASYYCTNIVWSPDGQRIAFVSGNINVYVMNADGTDLTRLTDYEPYPSGKYHEIQYVIWSPDGRRIAYNASGVTGLVVMNADGTNRTSLGDGDWYTWAP